MRNFFLVQQNFVANTSDPLFLFICTSSDAIQGVFSVVVFFLNRYHYHCHHYHHRHCHHYHHRHCRHRYHYHQVNNLSIHYLSITSSIDLSIYLHIHLFTYSSGHFKFS